MHNDDEANGVNRGGADNGSAGLRPLGWGARVIRGHRAHSKATSVRKALVTVPLVIALTTSMMIFAANQLGQPEVPGGDARAALDDAVNRDRVVGGLDGTPDIPGDLRPSTAKPSPSRSPSISQSTVKRTRTNAPRSTRPVTTTSTTKPPVAVTASTTTKPPATSPAPAPAPTVQQAPTTITYASFADVSGLAFNGAARQSNYVVRLAAQTGGDAGSAWSRQALDPARSFSTSFRLWLQQDGGDGLAFVVQSEGLGALGEGGSGLGYGDESGYNVVSPSMAVEFDAFDNDWEPSTGDNAIAITRNGDIKSQLASVEPNFWIWDDGPLTSGSTMMRWLTPCGSTPPSRAESPIIRWSRRTSTCRPPGYRRHVRGVYRRKRDVRRRPGRAELEPYPVAVRRPPQPRCRVGTTSPTNWT